MSRLILPEAIPQFDDDDNETKSRRFTVCFDWELFIWGMPLGAYLALVFSLAY